MEWYQHGVWRACVSEYQVVSDELWLCGLDVV